mgnify:FL=1
MAQNISNDLFNQGLAITPSDTVNHTWTFDAFLVGGAGNVVLVQEDNVTVTLTGLLAGHVYRIRGIRVNATSTTATSLVALRYGREL